MALQTANFVNDEKQAIIALQSVLNYRGHVGTDKLQRLRYFLDRLPPYRALIVFGHAMNAVADRLDKEDPFKAELQKMGQTIVRDMGHEFVDLIERDPEFYVRQAPLLAHNLEKISTIMASLAEARS
jgi:hypothetical protein